MGLNPLTELEQIEDRIVARIAANAAGLAGNVAAFGDEEAMKRAMKTYPFAGVVRSTGGDSWEEPQTFQTFVQDGTMRWKLYVFSRSQRPRKEARRGDEGSYKLSGECVIAVRGYDPIDDAEGPAGGHPIYLTERTAYQDEELGGAIYVEEIEIAHAVEI